MTGSTIPGTGITRHRLHTDPVADPAAVVQGPHFRITVLTDGLLRLEYAPRDDFEDRASTFAIRRHLPVPDYRVVDGETHLEVITDRLHLIYDRGPFSTSGLSVQVRGNVSSYHSIWRFGQAGTNLGGTARTLDNADGRIPLDPGILSRDGFAVLDDSASLLFTDDGWVAPRRPAADGRLDLYVFAYGRDYPQAMAAFYAVSGHPPLLPRYALGNWWSRYHRYTADEYTALLDRFAAAGVPFSVAVIDMDWHLVDIDSELGSGWTGYTWNRALFSDPAAFLADLHRRGLRVTLNVHPADGIRAHEDVYPRMARALGLDPDDRHPLAFDVTDPAFLQAYFAIAHRTREDEGVDFWWLDWQSGPYSRVAGVDPLWMLNHFHFLDSRRRRDGERGERRPLTFSRYAGPGSHRYPVGFSGDTLVSWASLAFQPEFTATASNIGYGWWSHDIGGHMMGVKDDELTARWVQLGAFSPILRLHSGSNPFATKEPWAFGPQTAAVMTDYLRLRHRLLPYLHTMNHLAAAGRPLVRPMYWDLPENPAAYGVPQQFSFGTELIVAPVTAPRHRELGLAAVSAWLPPGDWTDLTTGLRYHSPAPDGRRIVLHRTLSGYPVLARAGAIVPLDGAAEPGNAPGNPDHLHVLVVPGADGTFDLIEDSDLIGADPTGATDNTGDPVDTNDTVDTDDTDDLHGGTADPHRVVTPIRWDQAAGRLTVGPAEGDLSAVPDRRRWTVTILGVDSGRTVTARVDARSADVGSGAGAGLVPAGTDHAAGRTLTVSQVPVDGALTVDVGPDPQPTGNDIARRLFALLERAEIEYDRKRDLFELLTADSPLAVRVSGLQSLAVDRDLESALSEILLAAGTA